MREIHGAPRRCRRTVSLLLLLGALWSEDAWAAAEGLTLHWEAPTGCPDGGDVRSRVGRLAGSTAHVSPAIEARAVVERLASGRWRVDLETIQAGAHKPEARGSRVLEADSCQALADSIALILAVMVQPPTSLSALGPGSAAAPGGATRTRPSGALPPAPAPAPQPPHPVLSRAQPPSGLPPPPAPASPPPDAVPPRTQPSSSPPPAPGPASKPTMAPPPAAPPARATDPTPAPGRARPSFAVGLAATAASGLLPGLAWGGAVTAAWLGERWRFQAAGEYLASQNHAVDGHPSIVGEYSGVLGAIDACLEPSRRRLSGGVCVGIEGGGLHASSSGLRSPGSARSLWLATEIAAAVELVPTGRWALRCELGGAAAVRRPAFEIGGIGTVYEPARLTARGKIIAEILF